MSTDYQSVLVKVCTIVRKELGISENHEVGGDSSFRDDLGTDSLDTVELIMVFEEVFDIEIPESFGDTVVTVGDAAREITKILQAR